MTRKGQSRPHSSELARKQGRETGQAAVLERKNDLTNQVMNGGPKGRGEGGDTNFCHLGSEISHLGPLDRTQRRQCGHKCEKCSGHKSSLWHLGCDVRQGGCWGEQEGQKRVGATIGGA